MRMSIDEAGHDSSLTEIARLRFREPAYQLIALADSHDLRAFNRHRSAFDQRRRIGQYPAGAIKFRHQLNIPEPTVEPSGMTGKELDRVYRINIMRKRI